MNDCNKQEFLELYNKWHASYIFSAFGSADPKAKESYEQLKEWCENHKEDALQYIRELLLEEPGDIVRILDDLYKDKYPVKVEGFMPLDSYCNLWLNVISQDYNDNNNKIKIVNYYKDYNAWKNHLKKEYIPWNPFHEDDPNITLEEFKNGKRNPKGLRKKKMKELNLKES